MHYALCDKVMKPKPLEDWHYSDTVVLKYHDGFSTTTCCFDSIAHSCSFTLYQHFKGKFYYLFVVCYFTYKIILLIDLLLMFVLLSRRYHMQSQKYILLDIETREDTSCRLQPCRNRPEVTSSFCEIFLYYLVMHRHRQIVVK